MAKYFNSELAQEKLSKRSDRDSGCRFTSRCPFEHVSSFGKVVLQRPGKVRMTRTRRFHRFVLFGISLGHGQRVLSVLPVSVFEKNRDWGGNRDSVMNPG